MAHTNQQRKRIRQDSKRNTANTGLKSRIRTFVKKFETAVTGSDTVSIGDSFKAAMSELAKGARKGTISKGSAARKVSRMAARVRAGAAK